MWYTVAKEVDGMVYVYPTNTSFSTKKISKPKKVSEDAKALREYCRTHDISVIKDPTTGKLVAKVNDR